ncbi:MAG: NAD-dependent epimerase/dehydratase family protein [Stellaceae bacterium]
MIYVIGGKGFVGSAYVRLFQSLGLEHRVLTRDNFDSFRGTSCDVIINANGNSKKYLSDREPLTDFDQTVRSVADSITSIRCGTYVFLSSGDVYPDQTRAEMTHEERQIGAAQTSRYGFHKLLAETYVRGVHQRWLVMRMGGFVGPGLKKNAIYDMLTGGQVWLSPESELQFISTDHGARLVWQLVEREVANEVVNLGARGMIRLGTLHQRLKSPSVFRAAAPTVRYELSLEKLERLVGHALPDTQTEVETFLTSWAGKQPEGSSLVG